jgi:PhnB protein
MATDTVARVTASPRLAFKNGAKAIDFYKKAFGAQEGMRFEIEGKIAHAEVMIGDSVIMIAEEWPEGGRYSAETLGNSPVSMVINVPDVDAFAAHAIAAGAKLSIPIENHFYGYRQGTLLDPFGYSWGISTRTEELTVEEMHRRLREMQKK